MTEQNTSTPVSDSERPRRRRGGKTFLRDLIVIIVVAIIISVGIKAFLIRSFYIPSASMTNTLQINDRIIVNELVPNAIKIKRGDVIVFTDPGGWLPIAAPVAQNPVEWAMSAVGLNSSDSNDHLVKRVIGIGGDTVACCNAAGKITVNGVPIDETQYLNLPAGAKASAIPFSVKVPANSLWVMGDNRNDSEDSRFHAGTPTKGFVPDSDVVGRAFVISWPLNRLTWLSDYPDVFASVK